MKKTGSILVGLIAVFVLVFAVCTPSYAYFGAKVGAFLPNDDDLDGFDTGYSIEAFYGYEFNPNFALEAGVGYFRTEGSESDYDDYYNISIDMDGTISAIPLTLTAKGTYPLGQGFSLFAGAGVGAYFAQAEFDANAYSPEFGHESISDDDSETAFGFHVVAGAEYKLANGMSALAEFKWFTAEPEFTLFDEDMGESDIGGMVLSLGVKF